MSRLNVKTNNNKTNNNKTNNNKTKKKNKCIYCIFSFETSIVCIKIKCNI